MASQFCKSVECCHDENSCEALMTHSNSSSGFDESFDVDDVETVLTPRSYSPTHPELIKELATQSKLMQSISNPLFKGKTYQDTLLKPCPYTSEKMFDELPIINRINNKRHRVGHIKIDQATNLSPIPFSTSSGSRISLSSPIIADQMFLHKDVLPLKPVIVNFQVDENENDEICEDDVFFSPVTSQLGEDECSAANCNNIDTHIHTSIDKQMVKLAKKKKKNRNKNKSISDQEVPVESVAVESQSLAMSDHDVLVEKHGWDAESAALARKLELQDQKDKKDEIQEAIIEHFSDNSQDTSAGGEFRTYMSKRNRRNTKKEMTQDTSKTAPTQVFVPQRGAQPQTFYQGNNNKFYNGYRGTRCQQVVPPQYTRSPSVQSTKSSVNNTVITATAHNKNGVSSTEEFVSPTSFVAIASKPRRILTFSERVQSSVSNSQDKNVSAFLLALWSNFRNHHQFHQQKQEASA